jgi:hypothetical protein
MLPALDQCHRPTSCPSTSAPILPLCGGVSYIMTIALGCEPWPPLMMSLTGAPVSPHAIAPPGPTCGPAADEPEVEAVVPSAPSPHPCGTFRPLLCESIAHWTAKADLPTDATCILFADRLSDALIGHRVLKGVAIGHPLELATIPSDRKDPSRDCREVRPAPPTTFPLAELSIQFL